MLRHCCWVPALVAVLMVAVAPAKADWESWNCNLQVYWGALDGSPADTGDYFGVMPGATDEYDLIDSKKPARPLGDYVYAWFERPAWGDREIMCDWRAPIAEGTSKRWGTNALTDTWSVHTSLDNGPSGYFDPVCDPLQELEYPIAASVYLTWEFGVSETPPAPLPPDDYAFSLIYRGGINPKPAGTKLPDAMDPPAMNTVWDMEAMPHLVVPLWNDSYQPYLPDCSGFEEADVAKFLIVVDNPQDPLTCTFVSDPEGPQYQPATFTFAGTACCAGPYTFSWDFGDGASDVGNPVSHTYTGVGTFTVTCTVSNSAGDSGFCLGEVEVMPCGPPVCCFTFAPQSPTTADDVQFTDCSSDDCDPIVSWSWDFGDGAASDEQNSTHQYLAAGDYAVTLTVTADDGESAACTAATVSVTPCEQPVCCFTCDPAHAVPEEVVQFVDCSYAPCAGVVSWSWQFGDGGVSSQQHPTHQYATMGHYQVSLEVASDGGLSALCVGLLPVGFPPCNIYSYVGDGVAGDGGDGLPAPQARLRYPSGVAMGGDGSLYLADTYNNRVRKVDPAGFISTLAGNGSGGYSGDGGPAAEARLYWPTGVATGSDGSVYIADYYNHRVRKVSPGGVISTIAGIGYAGYSGDGGPATSARLNYPQDVAVAADGSLYITDSHNQRVRQVDPTGVITTVAGTGSAGYSGDGGPATLAELRYPRGLALDNAGALYIADTLNDRIRKVDPAGVITTVAGGGSGSDGMPATEARLNEPCGVRVDAGGVIYIADTDNHGVRGVDTGGFIFTIAGSGVSGYAGDGGLATECRLNYPRDVALGPDGALYIADRSNHSVRRVCGAAMAPICAITHTPADSAGVGELLIFDSHATDPDGGTVTSASWDFGDGGVASGVVATHGFDAVGTYLVTCALVDDEGQLGTCQLSVPVFVVPICHFTWSPVPPHAGQTITFDGSASSDPNGAVVDWEWDFGDEGSEAGAVVTHEYALARTYTASLTVTDSEGATTTCSHPVEIARNPNMHWNCNLQAYWGALYGSPACTWSYFGVQPGATDGYDLIDSKVPLPGASAKSGVRGNYVFAWFERPSWGQGRIIADWRSPIPEGTSKRWGTHILDTWNVKTNYDNGPSGYFHPCDLYQENEYPIAASIYLSWEFGIAETPPYPLPPADYTFSLMYRGGITAKPTGTKLPDAIEVPPVNTTWDMEATPYLVIPLWPDYFQPFYSDCSGVYSPDTARFFIIVDNPDTLPTCALTVDPAPPQEAPATFTFTATATGDVPLVVAWDFGDGGSDVGDPVSHTYDTSGEYTVTCTVTDANGDTAACSATVEVTEPCLAPVCCIEAAATALVGETVQFMDCSSQAAPNNLAERAWSFGDGGTSPAQNPTHAYAAPGTYTVCLMIRNDCDPPLSATCCQDISILVPPICCIDGPTQVVVGEEVCWTDCSSDPDGSIVSRAWYLDDSCPTLGGLKPDGGFEMGFQPVNQPCGDETGAIGNGWQAWLDGPSCWGAPYGFFDCTGEVHEGAHAQGVEYLTGSEGVFNLVEGLTPGKTHMLAGSIRIDSSDCYWAEFGCSDADPPFPGGGCSSPDDPYPDDVWLFKQDGWGVGPPPGTWYTCGPCRVTPQGTALAIWYKFGNACGGTPSVAHADGVSLVAAPDATETQFCRTFSGADVGLHNLTLEVTDNDGLTACCSHTVSVALPQLCFTLAGNCWHRISLPCQVANPDPWEVFDELRPPNQPVDLLSGCLHRYDHDWQTYVSYWRSAPSEFGPIAPGDGYLIWLFEDATICYAAECPDQPYAISLPTPGWYIIGTPHPHDTHVGDTDWYQSGSGPYLFGEIMNLWVQDPLLGWRCDWGRYYNVGLLPIDEDRYLRAFQGYWLYAFESDLTMVVPP